MTGPSANWLRVTLFLLLVTPGYAAAVEQPGPAAGIPDMFAVSSPAARGRMDDCCLACLPVDLQRAGCAEIVVARCDIRSTPNLELPEPRTSPARPRDPPSTP
jgi:hypothetical protein